MVYTFSKMRGRSKKVHINGHACQHEDIIKKGVYFLTAAEEYNWFRGY